MANNKPSSRSGWTWIPTLYYAEGIPYIVVMIVSVIMYKRMGISNTDIALYTSWLYLPWVIKPLWGPVVDILRTKRFWIVTMQLFVGAGLAGVALTIPVDSFFQYTLAFFWLLAFSSATHDIAADGFYMLGLSKHDQAWFVGIRSTFYRLAMITGQGLLVIVAGYIEAHSGLPPVDVPVESKAAQTEIVLSPEQMNWTQNGELGIITAPEKLMIGTERINAEKADSVTSYVKEWNLSHGFYPEEQKRQEEAAVAAEEPSWFDSAIIAPFEEFLSSNFGPDIEETAADAGKGNMGVIFLKLSEEPAEKVVVNFGREAGDNSISLVEGTRFTFTKENWDTPAMALIQLDPKLKGVSDATFTGRAGNIPLSWMITFFIMAGIFVIFFVYHWIMLPKPASDVPAKKEEGESFFRAFFNTFVLFFKRKEIFIIMAFLLLYRFAEAQLVKLASPFLLDAQEAGGLGLTTGEVGFVYGTVGIIALTLGGILGGIVAARDGLKKWIWWMAIAINLPNAVYVFLSYTMPDSFFIINLCVAVEQFGYGFGFTAYMLYMIYVSEGDHKTAHFAITTGFMALGMMIPGMFSGWLQELIGYQHFFVWVVLATIPAFIVIKFTPIDPEFGKKTESEEE